jgi:uncharacterized protein YbaP (TraB family)
VTRTIPALVVAATLLAAPGHAQSPQPSDESAAPVEEVEIFGDRPGPQLWKITNGDHVLWLLGILQPLPRRLQWQSAPVEEVLDHAREVIAEGGAVNAHLGLISGFRLYRQWRGLRVNPGERTLADVLPAGLYARFEALRAKYAPRDRDMVELRPIFAAGALFRAAAETVGLTLENDVHARVVKLAKKRDVPIRQVKIDLENPSETLAALGEIPLPQEIACLETTVARLETDVAAMRVRAQAWADGDLAAFRAAAYPDEQNACWNAIGSAKRIQPLVEKAQRDWLGLLDAALAGSDVSLAMQAMDRVLAPDGVLAYARNRGYDVRGPE